MLEFDMAKRRRSKSRSRKKHATHQKQVAQRQAVARKTSRPAANESAEQRAEEAWNSTVNIIAQSAENAGSQVAQRVEQSMEYAELFLPSPSIVSDGFVSFSRRLLELTQEQIDQNLRRTQRLLNARSTQEWLAALLRNNVEISAQSARLSIATIVDVTRRVSGIGAADPRSRQESKQS
jgi:hypothetical protein